MPICSEFWPKICVVGQSSPCPLPPSPTLLDWENSNMAIKNAVKIFKLGFRVEQNMSPEFRCKEITFLGLKNQNFYGQKFNLPLPHPQGRAQDFLMRGVMAVHFLKMHQIS